LILSEANDPQNIYLVCSLCLAGLFDYRLEPLTSDNQLYLNFVLCAMTFLVTIFTFSHETLFRK
jgi:hypothetical protein